MPWTQNLYTYVGNNPVNLVDPTGHEACTSEEAQTGVCTDASASSPSPSTTPTVMKLDDGREVQVYSDGRLFVVDTDGKETQVELPTSSSSGNWVMTHTGTFTLLVAGVLLTWAAGPGDTVSIGANGLKRNTAQVVMFKVVGTALNFVGLYTAEMDAGVPQWVDKLNQGVESGVQKLNDGINSSLKKLEHAIGVD